MGEKHLSDVINYERDIEPYRVIQIYSGVGSGKNYWVEQLVKQGKSVLLITSRKNTADAQAKKLNANRYIDLENIYQKKYNASQQNVCVTTNHVIEGYLMDNYDPENPKSHIWNYFDLVILDEAHSLVSDSYFSSSFHVMLFMSYLIHNTNNCKIIFMSGTPEPIQDMFSSKTRQSKEYNYLDLYDSCIHVDPEMVTLYPKADIVQQIKYYVEKGEKIIYFSNSISNLETLARELLSVGIPAENIGVGYSDAKVRDFDPVILQSKDKIEKALVEDEMIPNHIKVFLSTSKNKEGVNIKNSDIKIMIAEVCEKTTLIQMAGRVRTGLEHFVILYDTQAHEPKCTFEELELGWWCEEQINSYWESKEYDKTNENIIEMIEKKFPGLAYDYFSNSFKEYLGREEAYVESIDDLAFIKRCVNKAQNNYPSVVDINGNYIQRSGRDMLKLWFPNSETWVEVGQSPEDQVDELKCLLLKFITENNYIEKNFTKDEKDDFLDGLNEVLKSNSERLDYKKINIKLPYKQLAPILKRVGYEMRQLSHKKDSLYRLEKIQ